MNAPASEQTAGATLALANFVDRTKAADLPGSARHAARRALVNILGCCLSGARHEIVTTAARALLPLGGSGAASLLGRNERTDVLTATLLNTCASAAYSFDDTHAETILHPTGAVATALLALAETDRLSGEDFLLALVLGVEIASRASKAVSTPPAEGDIGWSQTGIAAGIGAAAAAGKVLGLAPGQLAAAIGIAALQASGLRVAHGTMAATLIFGHAAHTGLRAALLAREGFGAPVAALEGKYGFAALFGRHAHLSYLTDGLGRRYEIEALGYKAYPCGIVIHPALDAALAWRGAQGDRADAIRAVHLRCHPAALALGARRHPATVLEAKVSLYHWLAAALARGRAGIAEGAQAAIDAPEIVRLRDLIELEGDPGLAPDAATLTVSVGAAPQPAIAIARCKGSVGNAMSDDDLAAKYRGQAELVLDPGRAAKLLDACWSIDTLADAASIARLACPDA